MKKININLPEEILEKLDAYCKERFTNRAEVIRSLLLDLLMTSKKPIE